MSVAEGSRERFGGDAADEAVEDLWAFMSRQDYLAAFSLEQLRAAKRREELGITSLGVIMLVATYMEAKGVSQAGFRPEWVPRLDSIAGIVAVFSDIRREVAAPGR